MYWGHAVSRDLIHWTHMPYVLEPQPDLWRDKEHKGGAFSGSAQVEGEQMHLYLTRHHGPQEDGEETRDRGCLLGRHPCGEGAPVHY